MLIIGSAAGVVAMGMEKIDFFLVFKKDYLVGSYRFFRWFYYLDFYSRLYNIMTEA
jgi:hypothetical protein